MTTRSDPDERLAQNPQTSSVKASIFRDGFSQESLKAVSLPPLEKEDSVREMMSSEKEVKSPPLASVLEKDEETIRSESAEASFSKERESMDVDCHGVFSVPEATSAFLEEDRHKMEEAVEADGSAAFISEKKGQEDSDVQADVDTLAMASDVHIIEKNGSHQHQKVERVRVKDNAFVGRSVKIDVVDDTALLNVVPFSKKAKDHPKHKRNGGKHIVVSGKQQDKGNASKVGEGSQLRIMYSINQMKSMRYANMGNQKKLWSDVYARLLPELVNEYEGLVVSLKNQKTSKSNMRESGIGTKEVIDELTLEEEEEYTEENDDYNSILKPAFAVDGEPDFESGPPEERSDCKWVVALCASVETPLDGDTCASLRALVRKCASLRALEVEDEQGFALICFSLSLSVMTTRSDSDERLAQNPLTSSVKASIFRDGFSQDSLKAVSLPPLEKEDSVGEMTSSEKEVKSSPFASVLGKDEESIRSDSSEASFSKEREAMDVDCHGVVSVPEATSAFLEEDRHKMEEAVEADGSAACISEKKGQEDSDVQAEVDTLAMASDVRIIEKNGSHQHQKVERVRVKDNAFVGRSVKINVVDDTALLNVVPFSKKAKDHPKHKRNGGKHIVVGGKQQGKGNASKVGERSQLRIMYSLSQMKSMRYANMGNQKKLWSDVYARLLPELVNEYEGLVVSLKNQKNSKSNMRESGIGTKEVIDELTLEEEEEYTEENDDYNSILKPAFAVDGEPDFESGPPEERSDCKWVVALCASVETPLDGDTCASLRALVRKCASLRALEVEDEQVIIMANMLITIAGRYFGQMK
ncbi:hypothetical protein F2Q70_00028753 [Brassica cretica]|uniref:Gem-associated protein 2 n=1 Tax=Brassica cretica TaxID=69181 RepID=A0A8S9LA78_BRACR|nr:hypothetical protein F2Q70_00028753 [Brassica cretica]